MVKCEICGREFQKLSRHLTGKHPEISHQEYYNKYLKKTGEGVCKTCGGPTKFNGLHLGYSIFCSNKCINNDPYVKQQKVKSQKKTMLQRYGVENPLHLKEVRTKIKETCLKNYGVDNPSKSKIIINKIKNTTEKRYGVSNVMKLDVFKKKSQDTCLRKYGVANVFQNKDIQESYLHTLKKTYGEEVNNINDIPIVRQKKRKKIVDRFLKDLQIILQQLNLELLDPEYQTAHYLHNWKCTKCGCEFQQIWNAIQQGYTCPKCYPRNQGFSKGEKELLEYIKELLPNEIIEENNRKLINPFELDVVIPNKGIAIEFNGLYWHSEQNITDINYHVKKMKHCEKQGIQLIQIFEDEWLFKQEIVKSRLKHILHCSDSIKIYARDCIIKEITSSEKNEFLEKYHIQGKDICKISLGAFYNDELVSVMTFGYGNIAKGSRKQEGIWELNRFCANYNYHIPGIFGKLLEHFKRNYEWKEIFSYADRRWSVGKMYEKLGFMQVSETTSNYWYIKDFKRIHRFNLRKQLDEPKEIPEWILRLEEGYYRIWDCGNLKFELLNK